ncbi:ABC transporter ATP-binding protein [Polynucleobacter sp. MWH-Berg-3C6]|uniref:ABC transporter ATP-binding protein n=1 Tax=Polynucleobacter sp. MWH-Berg-3C6 TaxID=1855882 RepID=UPI001C0BCF67|nr:ABC transporter ATP-binding protein [Polynucleobacter sp. MWH-Berg-3C6]MBU3549909.1 ABC transporter ATP-binding protein [Polynucleobacter sp. MWH-Berg-3C6]
MTDIAISVSGVSKCYRVFENQRSRLMHAIFPMYTGGVEEIWALQDINFEIKRGEAVAIIGRNGGGKSTLLEILTGTLTQTAGAVQVNGRVSALLELGSGFNPEYSGRDNVILNGLLLGLSKDEIVNRFAEIEAFAEIGAAIERPVKTYSSGMMMRLAFAVQVLCHPDILIIDEALSVGDFFFQQKCFSYIRNLHAKGVTLLFVSHDMSAVRDLCSSAIYLRDGCLNLSGEVNSVIQSYLKDHFKHGIVRLQPSDQDDQIETQITKSLSFEKAPYWQCEKTFQDKATKILAIWIEDSRNESKENFEIGDYCQFKLLYCCQESDPVQCSIVIKNRYDQVINCTSTHNLGIEMPYKTGSQGKIFSINIQMMIESGQYSFMFSLGIIGSQLNQGVTLDETPWLGPLNVTWDYSSETPLFYGMFGLPVKINLADSM